MGRLIDADLLREEVNSWGMNDYEPSDFTDVIDDAPTVEAIPKDQYEARLKENNELINDLEELRTMINKFAESYENRLKADMMAMLDKVRAEIEQTHETEDGFLMHEGTKKTILSIIDRCKSESEET